VEQEDRKRPDVLKEYADEHITVYWEPAYCIHTAICINRLPGVFDPAARPWIDIGAAGADEIADAVMRCPTGALHFGRHDGGPEEPTPDETTVQPRTNGPLFVRGNLKLIDAERAIVREDTRAALCRCGQSANKPFCDGTHRADGFRAP
jgi:uncharacterized Fe-S cluster protein YjdI